MFNIHDLSRDACMLHGPLKHQGYDWWWHSFTGRDETTGEEKPFFIEFFVCNPALCGDEPIFGQLSKNRQAGIFSFHENNENVYWHVVQENIHALMDTEITCRKKDMLLVNYEAPDGSKRHNRLWNGGNGRGIIRLYDRKGRDLELVDEIIAAYVGCEYGEYDS